MTYFKVYYILISFLPLVKQEIIINDLGTNKIFQEYTQLAAYMTRRFISPKTNTLIIIEKCDVICYKYHNYHISLLANYVQHLNETLSIQLFAGKHGDRPWDYNLFIVDSFFAFQSLRYSFPTTDQERLFYFFIILTWSPNTQTQFQIMQNIFKLCYYFNVRNVVIMSKSISNDTIHFYTYEIFTPHHCNDKITIEEINRYESGKLQKDLLFPNPILNYYGCVLNVTAQIMEPLLSFDGDMDNPEHLMDMQRLGGIEGDILNILADLLNLNFRLRFPRDKNEIRSYGNSTGCFGDLQQHRAELAVGGLSAILPNAHKFTSSITYHTTPYVFVVRSGVCFGPIKQLLNPFDIKIWILILVSCVVFIIVMKVAEHYRKPVMRDFLFGTQNKYPIRYMCVIFLGNPIPIHILPKRNFARFFIISWMLLTFEIRNGYQGKMYDSLRHAKRIPIPRKISELNDLDFTLLSSDYNHYYPANKTYIVNNRTERLHLVQQNVLKLTTTTLLDYLVNYNLKNRNTSSLTYVKEAIYSYQCVMFFRKHSIIQASVNWRLKALYDGGIVSYIAKQHVRSYFRNMNTQTEYEFELSNRNLKGLYYIYILMCIISIFIFAAEIFTRKSQKLRNLMDWLHSM